MAALLQSLADALNISESDARAALDAFVERLRAQVREHGSVTYGGLGTFGMTGTRLTFTPDESVALVVNHRYAGMEPIPIGAGVPPTWQAGVPDDEHPLGPAPSDVFEDAAFEEVNLSELEETVPEPEAGFTEEAPAPEAETEPEDEEPAWADVPPPSSTDLPPLFASDETLMALRDAAREMEATPPSEEADEWAARMIEEETAPVEDDLPPPPLSSASMPVEAHMEMPPEYDAEAEEEAAAEDVEPVEDVAPLMVPAESVAAVTPATPATPMPPPRPRERVEVPPERRFPWVPTLLLLALVGIVLAVLWMRRPAVQEPPAASPVASADTLSTPDTTRTAATPAETTAAVTETPAEPEPAETPPDDALRGTAPVVAGQGYTIVVGGGTQAQASSLAASFRQQGYRTGVLAGQTGRGAQIYRVGVGQFGSLGAAQQALTELGDAVPSDAWILHLR